MKSFEVIFYPLKHGDGFQISCRTKKTAIKKLVELIKNYPNIEGDCYIRVFESEDGIEWDCIDDIEVEECNIKKA